MKLEGDDWYGLIPAEEVNDGVTKKRVYDRVGLAESCFESPDDSDYVLLGITHRGFSYWSPGEYDIRRIAVDLATRSGFPGSQARSRAGAS